MSSKEIDKELLELCYKDFISKKALYDKMYSYFKGDTDAMKDYKMITSRSNSKVDVNFFKKFLKEEVSYSVGNDINYTSLGDDVELEEEVLKDIRYYLAHIPSDHDIDLFKDMLIHSISYELYSFDNNGDFNMTVLTPNESYLYENELGEIEFFMHVYKKRFTDEIVIKVYTNQEIIFYNEHYKEWDRKRHKFKSVPVGVARVSDELEDDSLYKDIKGLQDAYEIVMSDAVNEISDFRNAYLTLSGVQIDDEDLPKMKEDGIMQFPNAEGKAAWLTKEINDTFIQNTLDNLESKMYEITNHINFNENMQSNTSSLAIKARLTALSQKCGVQEKAFANCIQTRIKFLFEYIEFITNTKYKGDWRNIVVKFTPNLPSDDLGTAQLISQLDGKVSTQTLLSLLSFIENPESEMEKVDSEYEKLYGSELDVLETVDDVVE